MRANPDVAVIVLNYNGERHLRTCLPGLEAQDYANPAIVVADNGSTDGSLSYVRAQHPRVRVIEMGGNLGFAKAYNRAIRDTRAEYVVLLNNDTRVEPAWLSTLIDTIQRHGASAAASCMLDWDGRHIDFAGGLPTFLGHAWQVDHGLPVGREYHERPLLFGCAGALAIRREVFLGVGGFDDDYFAYFEDVDLGWRMSLAGHVTVLAPAAVTYHRLHGTASGWGHTLRLRLYERNALCTIFKNYGDEALGRILPAAIALTLGRALEVEDLDRNAIRFGRAAPERMDLPPRIIATLLALEDFARALPQLQRKRAQTQAARRVPDEVLFALFPEPLKLHEVSDAYRETARALVRDFRIAELFGLQAPERVSGTPQGVEVPERDAESKRPDMSPVALPTVSIVVLTASGARHLPDCLDSIRAHAWPADRTEVIVVDNGSDEDPSAEAERHFPGVRVVRTGANLGFSAGNNAGARAATGSWLVFLNDDTRVAPDWLNEMIGVADRRGAASVGAFIVDWTGTRVDFAGGLVNYEGRGYATGYDLDVADIELEERPLLFGCGAAVLIRRDAFESSGGWDEPTFAYYEDVELGWRLWVLGHEVWFAPKAVVYHRHHGTSGSESPARLRAFERNALRMLYALLEERSLQQVLPAALLLAMDRALLGTPFSRAEPELANTGTLRGLAARLDPHTVWVRLLHALSQRGARRQYGTLRNLRRVGPKGLAEAVVDAIRDLRFGWQSPGERRSYLIEQARPTAELEGRSESIPVVAAAQLLGLQDFLAMLPELSQRRAWLQVRRRRTDAEIVERFGACWRSSVPSPHMALHLELRDEVTDVLAASRPLPPALDLRRRRPER